MGRRCGFASVVFGIVSPTPGGPSGSKLPGGEGVRFVVITTSWRQSRANAGGCFGILVRAVVVSARPCEAPGVWLAGPSVLATACTQIVFRKRVEQLERGVMAAAIVGPGLCTGSLRDALCADEEHSLQPGGFDVVNDENGLAMPVCRAALHEQLLVSPRWFSSR